MPHAINITVSIMRSTRLLTLTALTVCSLFFSIPTSQASSGGAEKPKADAHGSKSAEESKAATKDRKEEAATITGGQSDADPIYLHLPVVTFPIIDDGGAQQIVSLLIDLHMKDRPSAEKIQSSMPKLKDAIIQALYGGMSDRSMRNAQMLDISKVKDGIVQTLNRIYGDGFVNDVLIQAVSQRKL